MTDGKIYNILKIYDTSETQLVKNKQHSLSRYSSLINHFNKSLHYIIVIISIHLTIIKTLLPILSDVRYDFRIKTMFGSSFLQSITGGLMSYLRYVCLFAYNGVQHTMCCVFVLLVFVLPVSLECPILIACLGIL